MKIGDAPEYLTGQLRYVGEVQPYSLRNVMDFRNQQAKMKLMLMFLGSVNFIRSIN